MQFWDFHSIFHLLFLRAELFTVSFLQSFYLIFLFVTGEPLFTAASVLYCEDWRTLASFFFLISYPDNAFLGPHVPPYKIKWHVQYLSKKAIMHLHCTTLNSASATHAQSRAGCSTEWECHGSQRAEWPIFISQLWNCKIWNENPPLLHQYGAITSYREIAHATRRSILLSLATSQMQSETQ